MGLGTLRILFICMGILLFAASLLTPLYALFAEDLGASIVIVGLLASTLFGCKSVAVLLLRSVSNKITAAGKMFVIAILLHVIAWIVLFFANEIWHLFVAQAVLGVSIAIAAPVYRMLLAQNLPTGKEVRTYAVWEMIKALSGLLASVLGALVVTAYGFQVLFLVMAGLGLVSAVIAITYLQYLVIKV